MVPWSSYNLLAFFRRWRKSTINNHQGIGISYHIILFQSFLYCHLLLYVHAIITTKGNAVSVYSLCLILHFYWIPRYQSTQQHPQAQHVMQYHNTGHVGQYMDGSREDRVMTELSVHQELPVHQEFSIHQEFLGHQDLDFHHDFTGHQEPIVQHHHQTADPSQGSVSSVLFLSLVFVFEI